MFFLASQGNEPIGNVRRIFAAVKVVATVADRDIKTFAASFVIKLFVDSKVH